MLGGVASSDSTLKRPLSDIELRLTSRITSVFLRELATGWGNAVQLNIEVQRVESNPQLVQIVPPNEVVILVSFELTMGKTRGMINLCIPFNTIERIGTKLSSNSWIGYASSRSSDDTQAKIQENLEHAVAELVVTLAHSRIKTSDLFALQVGDVISTEKDVHTPLEVEVEGVVKYLAAPGAFKGRTAIEIRSIVERKQVGQWLSRRALARSPRNCLQGTRGPTPAQRFSHGTACCSTRLSRRALAPVPPGIARRAHVARPAQRFTRYCMLAHKAEPAGASPVPTPELPAGHTWPAPAQRFTRYCMLAHKAEPAGASAGTLKFLPVAQHASLRDVLFCHSIFVR